MTTKRLDLTTANGSLFRFVLLPDGRPVGKWAGKPGFTETGGIRGVAVVRNNGEPTLEIYDRTPTDWNLRYGFGDLDGNYVTGGWLAANIRADVGLKFYPGYVIDADTMTTVRDWLTTVTAETTEEMAA